MAKKRSSSRGKGAGSPGAGEEKGKGIDLLFGGAAGASAEADEAAAEEAPGAYFAPPPPPPTPDAVPIESLPTGSGSQETPSTGQAVDEFGLPVAMDQPPPDLELAVPETPPPTPPDDDSSTLDFSLPTDLDGTLPTGPTDTGTETISETDLGDLSLDLDLGDDDLSGLEDDNLAEVDTDDDLSGLDDTDLAPGDFGDLNGDDLSGIDTSIPDPTPPTTDPPLVSDPMPPAPIDVEPEPLPPTITPPLDPTPPIAEPQQPTTPDFSAPGPATQPPTVPPSTPPPPPTSSIAPPRARIDSIGGIVSEKIQVVEKDILPDDTKFSGGPVSGVLTVADRAQVEENELITQKVTRYIGRERREKLDKEIESLYDKVADELSVNTKDTEFALRTLSQAQDIIFEDARQYDEALYRVAVVKTMLTRKNNLRRWSYTWGTAVFFYAIVWLVAFIAGFMLTDIIRSFLDSAVITSESSQLVAIRAAWFSALAGGIGGVIGILYSLYWHVSIKQDFDRQYVMYYFVQPVMGFILGALVYFIIGAGFLVVNFSSNTGAEAGDVLSSTTVIAFQVVIGWVAGFRQRKVFEMIDKIVQRISPKDATEDESGDEPATVMPAGDPLGGGRSARR